MSKYVSVNDFSGEITKIVKSWTSDVQEVTQETIKEIAEESRDELKVAGDFKNRSGKYRKGWKVSFEESRYGLSAIVHNKEYPLTHLLESGHAKWLFGRDTGDEVKAFPHIENVNDEAQKKLELELARRINDL